MTEQNEQIAKTSDHRAAISFDDHLREMTKSLIDLAREVEKLAVKRIVVLDARDDNCLNEATYQMRSASSNASLLRAKAMRLHEQISTCDKFVEHYNADARP